MQAGHCPYCDGRSRVTFDGDPVDAEQQARIQSASVLFHIAVAHDEEAVASTVELWAAQIAVARLAAFQVKCPLCTFRCQIPAARAIRVLLSHFGQSHRMMLLGSAVAILTPLLLGLWAVIAVIQSLR